MHANKLSVSLLPALLCVALAAGCSPASNSSVDAQTSALGFITLDKQRVQLRSDKSRAEISADGALSIDGRAIALNPQQRVLSQRYYTHAMAIGVQGAAMGRAGAQLAGDAVRGAIGEALQGGNPDNAGKQVEAQAAELQKQSLRMCEQVSALHTAQQALGASVPEFKPFARVQATDVNDCKQ